MSTSLGVLKLRPAPQIQMLFSLDAQFKCDLFVCVCVCVTAAVVWSLHRDLGFPLDLVDLMLEERGVQVDRQELDRLIAENHKVKHHEASLLLCCCDAKGLHEAE